LDRVGREGLLIDDLLQSGSDFASMDFPTRNLYRSAIEGLARGSKLTELEIARLDRLRIKSRLRKLLRG
jgi:hypothetical protein